MIPFPRITKQELEAEMRKEAEQEAVSDKPSFDGSFGLLARTMHYAMSDWTPGQTTELENFATGSSEAEIEYATTELQKLGWTVRIERLTEPDEVYLHIS